ncbi:unnamed protein product [Laminaria digitata]
MPCCNTIPRTHNMQVRYHSRNSYPLLFRLGLGSTCCLLLMLVVLLVVLLWFRCRCCCCCRSQPPRRCFC